jgi:hypothetical protein
MPEDHENVTHEGLSRQVTDVQKLLYWVMGTGVLIAVATGAGAISVYTRTEIHDKEINEVKASRLAERISALEATRFTQADGNALQSALTAQMTTLTRLVSDLQVTMARDGHSMEPRR